MRAQITCLVQEGDLPITISWQKNGQKLYSDLGRNSIPLGRSLEGLHISQLNDFTSVLVIEKAKAEHSGKYNCAASNSAKTSFASASLKVTGGRTIF